MAENDEYRSGSNQMSRGDLDAIIYAYRDELIRLLTAARDYHHAVTDVMIAMPTERVAVDIGIAYMKARESLLAAFTKAATITKT